MFKGLDRHFVTVDQRKSGEKLGQGYERLSGMIPALRAQSFMRKYIQAGAANYVQELTDGNQVLQRQLDDIKATCN